MHWLRLTPVFMVLALLVPTGQEVAAAAKGEAKFIAQRAKVREQRADLRAKVIADRQRRAEEGEAAIRELVEIASENRVAGQREQIGAMVQAVRRLDPDRAKPLQELVDSLPEAPEEADRRTLRNWQSKRYGVLKATLGRTGELLKNSINVGMTDLAYEFLREILTFDPDRGPLRKDLGHVSIDGEWLDAYAAKMAKQGLMWDTKLGWVSRKMRDRYDNGEFFDLQARKWTTLEEANAAHADPKNPWIVRTAHLEIYSTTSIENVADVATKLEMFYQQIFAAYANFFAKGRADYKLVFGLADHPPLKLWVYSSREEYLRENPDFPGWSAGVFSPSAGFSYFYGKVSSVMYHEFTHQILHIFTGTNRAPAWLTESIAQYTETPTYVFGDLVLGNFEASRDTHRHLMMKAKKEHMPLNRLLSINTGQKWSGTNNPGPQYAAAAALAWFCMEADDRAYRADFIDFLRDSYQGVATFPMWSYLGMSESDFKQRYEAWENEAMKALQ